MFLVGKVIARIEIEMAETATQLRQSYQKKLKCKTVGLFETKSIILRTDKQTRERHKSVKILCHTPSVIGQNTTPTRKKGGYPVLRVDGVVAATPGLKMKMLH